MLILTLEASTSSAKALLYDSVKGIVDAKMVSYDRSISDVATQDCEGVYRSVLEVGSSVAASQDVEAIALCGTWHSIVVCDVSMKPITPTYSWAYTESVKETMQIRQDRKQMLELYHRTGCMVHNTYGFYTLLHLKGMGLRLSDKLFASQAGYIYYAMTGERIETHSIMSGSGLLNLHTQDYDPEALSMLGLDPKQFGRLTDYRETHPLCKEAALSLGVKSGIPVIPPYPDGALNQLGAGALKEGIMTLSVGTSAAMRLSVPAPTLPEEPATWCYVGVDSYVAGAAIAGACSCVDWFHRNLFNGYMSLKALDDSAEGCTSTPIFLPFIFGERCPGWQDTRLGGFFDIAPKQSFDAMYQAVLEGICFNLLQCYTILVSLTGEPEVIKLSGGIINSPFWTQMLSDILRKELQVLSFDHASSLGAAALALSVCGELSSLSDFEIGSDRLVEPHSDTQDEYTKKYERYLSWYEKTR